jgi:hypothetical protein
MAVGLNPAIVVNVGNLNNKSLCEYTCNQSLKEGNRTNSQNTCINVPDTMVSFKLNWGVMNQQ